MKHFSTVLEYIKRTSPLNKKEDDVINLNKSFGNHIKHLKNRILEILINGQKKIRFFFS